MKTTHTEVKTVTYGIRWRDAFLIAAMPGAVCLLVWLLTLVVR